MLDTIFGLPVHPLLVHATVVGVPAAAAIVALAATWGRFRAWAGWLPVLLSTAALVLVPLSTESGEALRQRVGETALVERHAELAEGLLPWVAVLLAAAVLLAWNARRPPRRALAIAAVALALVGAVGSTVQVALIGHSGAKASWSDVAQSGSTSGTSLGGGDDGDRD